MPPKLPEEEGWQFLRVPTRRKSITNIAWRRRFSPDANEKTPGPWSSFSSNMKIPSVTTCETKSSRYGALLQIAAQEPVCVPTMRWTPRIYSSMLCPSVSHGMRSNSWCFYKIFSKSRQGDHPVIWSWLRWRRLDNFELPANSRHWRLSGQPPRPLGTMQTMCFGYPSQRVEAQYVMVNGETTFVKDGHFAWCTTAAARIDDRVYYLTGCPLAFVFRASGMGQTFVDPAILKRYQ